MKIGITNSSYYIGLSNIIDYKEISSHGFECVDFQNLADIDGDLYKLPDDEFKKTLTKEREMAQKAGITISQVHGPWPVDDKTQQSRDATFEYMKKTVQGTSILGSKYIIIHPKMPNWGHEDDSDEIERMNERFFSKICSFAQEYNVNICVENMPMTNLRLSRTTKILEFVKKLNLPNLFICFDTGNSNCFGDDCGEMVRLCGDYIKTLHVHDNSGRADEHLFPYCGTINWESFKSALFDIGFDGVLSIEANNKFAGELKEYMQKGLAKIARQLIER